MARPTVAQVQQAFLDRRPLKTTHLESTEDGRLLSYGWYEIARWVTTCRLHGTNVPTFLDDAAHETLPCSRTRILRRNNGTYHGRPNGWYSVSTARHASHIYGLNVEDSPVPTPKSEAEMRF